jgi:beta-glucanase (GH16 family)
MSKKHFMKTTQYFSFITSALFLSIALAGCKVDPEQTLPERNWKLVWGDDFNGNAGDAPDPAKWKFDIGRGNNGWGNSELQYYTDRPANASLDGNGVLQITARREAFGGAAFSSARLKTQGVFAQKYGRFEARIKTPFGPGIWPAFWMLGENINQVSWPQCGEIDILEQRGQQPATTIGSVHGPGYSGGNAISKSYTLTNGRFDAEYHVYAVEWGEDYIDYFVDDYLYHRLVPGNVKGEWVFNQPFFMILNVAVGGNFVGFPTTATPFPQTMFVDYVRVYQLANE